MKKDASSGPVTMADKSTTQERTEEEKSGFLSRWSRQKSAGVEQSGQTVEVADEDIAAIGATVTAGAESTEAGNTDSEGGSVTTEDPHHSLGDSADSPVANSANPEARELEEQEPLLTDVDMPALDTLNSGSDYSAFFSKGVSKELRQQALRHLFSHAKFNIRDGLNDYDEDYTTFEPLGDTVTSDMRWHKARKEREEKERLEAEALAQQRQEELEQQQAESDLAESADQHEGEKPLEESADAEQNDALHGPDAEAAEIPQNNTPGAADDAANSIDGAGKEQLASVEDKARGNDTADDKIASTHDVVEGT